MTYKDVQDARRSIVPIGRHWFRLGKMFFKRVGPALSGEWKRIGNRDALSRNADFMRVFRDFLEKLKAMDPATRPREPQCYKYGGNMTRLDDTACHAYAVTK